MLRQAGLADVPALRALETACFGPDAWGDQALRGELAGMPETRYVVVAEHAGAIVGYATLLASGATSDVQRIAVHPDRQGMGLGRRLLDALLAEARRRGCVEAMLEVAADNAAAIAMYEAYGFDTVARRPGYYGAGRTDALVLRLAPLAPPTPPR